MTYYVIVSDGAGTFGLFTTEQRAKDEIKKIHANGYFGELGICEEEVTEDKQS